MTQLTAGEFQATVMGYYHAHGRHDLPWRQPETNDLFDPYKILVSEIMLQQTQVARVIPKYRLFLQAFPGIRVLAQSPFSEVLSAWSGLGYNRRAMYLWETAKIIDGSSTFPQSLEELQKLPGIGPNTAGAIVAYAFNRPVSFIETNIRTVYISHFFSGQHAVSDASIRELVNETLDRGQPRQWYWALMDYGSYLKISVGNVNRSSSNYVRQSNFAGSNRQIRGYVIRELLKKQRNIRELQDLIDDSRLGAVLSTLLDEHMIVERNGVYSISP
jgi:A/G-specific adenine glycosylase